MNYRIVTDADAIDRKEWERFVYDHPQGNVFQTPQMYAAYAATKNFQPIVVACYEKDSLTGILLAVVQKEYQGFLGKLSARSIIWGGPLARSEEQVLILLNHYSLIANKKVIFSQFRNLYCQNSSLRKVFEMKGFLYEDHLNILVDLSRGEAEYWKGVKRNRKDGINKAKRQGFIFEASDEPKYIECFYTLLKETYNNARLPYPDIGFFESLNKEMSENIKWFVLKKDDVPIIVLAAFIFKGSIQAFYIGITRNNVILNLRPVDLFYHEVICWGIENGFHTFDWMGAGKPDKEYGVRKFKLQYGGDVLEMGRYEKIHKPIIMGFAKMGFRMWQLLKKGK